MNVMLQPDGPADCEALIIMLTYDMPVHVWYMLGVRVSEDLLVWHAQTSTFADSSNLTPSWDFDAKQITRSR